MVTPFVQQVGAARWVLQGTVLAFVFSEVLTALRQRRGAQRVSLRAEVELRLMFIGAVILLAAFPSLTPAAVIGGGVVVLAAAVVGSWLGLLLRWWSGSTIDRVGDAMPTHGWSLCALSARLCDGHGERVPWPKLDIPGF